MPDHRRPERIQHLILSIEIVLEQPLVAPPRDAARAKVQGAIEVDGDLVHVMDGADKEFGAGDSEEGVDERGARGADPFALEADEQGDGGGVFGAEA
jgi:hypothetical protein